MMMTEVVKDNEGKLPYGLKDPMTYGARKPSLVANAQTSRQMLVLILKT